jgi:hypothetical protein
VVSVPHSNYTGFCMQYSRMQGGLSMQSCHISCVRPCAFGRRVQQNCMRLHQRPVRALSAKASGKADAFTLLLDCDGVLVDTEAQGHRISFNEAFKQKGQADHCSRARTGLLTLSLCLHKHRLQGWILSGASRPTVICSPSAEAKNACRTISQ